MKGGVEMQMDFMDVRLDDKKLPYAVHKAVEEYAGDKASA